MKLEKETYTKEEVQKLCSWLMNKCVLDQERYIADEEFMIRFMKLPWWKRLFIGNRLINRHLYQVIMEDSPKPILE